MLAARPALRSRLATRGVPLFHPDDELDSMYLAKGGGMNRPIASSVDDLGVSGWWCASINQPLFHHQVENPWQVVKQSYRSLWCENQSASWNFVRLRTLLVLSVWAVRAKRQPSSYSVKGDTTQ